MNPHSSPFSFLLSPSQLLLPTEDGMTDLLSAFPSALPPTPSPVQDAFEMFPEIWFTGAAESPTYEHCDEANALYSSIGTSHALPATPDDELDSLALPSHTFASWPDPGNLLFELPPFCQADLASVNPVFELDETTITTTTPEVDWWEKIFPDTPIPIPPSNNLTSRVELAPPDPLPTTLPLSVQSSILPTTLTLMPRPQGNHVNDQHPPMSTYEDALNSLLLQQPTPPWDTLTCPAPPPFFLPLDISAPPWPEEEASPDSEPTPSPLPPPSPSSTRYTHLCPSCPRRFTRRYNLLAHVRAIHSLERPFVCHLCPLRFTRKHDFDRHAVSCHLNVKPFRCERCGKRFARSDALGKHKGRRRCRKGD